MNRTVELSDNEGIAQDYFERLLDQGTPLPSAAQFAINRTIRETGQPAVFFDSYATWLSEGTITRRGNRFNVRPEWR